MISGFDPPASSAGLSTQSRRWVRLACAYAALVGGSTVAIQCLTDRLLPATLIAFGPRWLLALPLVALTGAGLAVLPVRQMPLAGAGLGLVAGMLMFGVLDFRLGTGRSSLSPSLRVMTYNLGGSTVTSKTLDEFLRREHVDVAALQECPFYDYGPKYLGWHFDYGGDLCLVSRYPFTRLDPVVEPDADEREGNPGPVRVEISTGTGRFQFMNVHLETVRGGLEALAGNGWAGLQLFAHNRFEAARDSVLARQLIRSVATPFIVAGDFNLSVESQIYKQNWGDLRNAFSSCGRGFGHTKDASVYGIRIDHVLTSDQWECTDTRVLSTPYDGDHSPLIVDLRRKR
jgi:hypothetical protein